MSIDRHNRVTDHTLPGFIVLTIIFVIGVVVGPIAGQKLAQVGPFIIPAALVTYSLTFTMSDIVAEVYGRSYARLTVLAGFVGQIVSIILLQIALNLPAADVWKNHEPYEMILNSGFRVTVAALIAYILAQYLDVYVFSLMRKKTRGKFLWLRNNISTMCSQTLHAIAFVSIAYYGVIPDAKLIAVMLSNFGFRYLMAVFDTPIVYGGVYALYKFYPELKDKKNGELATD